MWVSLLRGTQRQNFVVPWCLAVVPGMHSKGPAHCKDNGVWTSARPDEMELSGFPICWEIGCCQGLFHDDQLSLQYAWVEGTSSLPCIVCSGFGYKNGKCLTSFIVFQEKFDEYCHPISLLCSPMLISQYSVLLNMSSFVQPPFFWFESLVSNGPGKKKKPVLDLRQGGSWLWAWPW